jgi:hypothetical protein
MVSLMFERVWWCCCLVYSGFAVFSSREMLWNGCADLQFNITLKCVICLCWCPCSNCSICSVEQLGNMVNVAWWLSGLFYRLWFVDMSSLPSPSARYDMKLLLSQKIMWICLQRSFIYPSRVLSVYIRCEEKNPNFNTFFCLATKTKRVSKHGLTFAYFIVAETRWLCNRVKFFSLLFWQHQTTRDRFWR